MGLADMLGIEVVEVTKTRGEVTMQVTPDLYQSFGFLHGGATIALLETAASMAGERSADFARERSFGLDVHVRHRKPGKQGVLRGIAELDHEEPSFAGGRKQFWRVAAVDEEGDTVSEGQVVTKIVTLEHLQAKDAARSAARAGGGTGGAGSSATA